MKVDRRHRFRLRLVQVMNQFGTDRNQLSARVESRIELGIQTDCRAALTTSNDCSALVWAFA